MIIVPDTAPRRRREPPSRARYRIGDVHLQLNVQNLLDDHYVGSAFGAGAQDFATWGPERTVRGSLSYRW